MKTARPPLTVSEARAYEALGIPTDGRDRTPAEVAQIVLRVIEQHPGNHDQRFWIAQAAPLGLNSHRAIDCGTTCCVAGWAAIAGGYVFSDTDTVVRYPGPSVTVWLVARGLLGLRPSQATWLFDQARTRKQVRKALTRIIDGGDLDDYIARQRERR